MALFLPLLGEFLGTALLILLGEGVVAGVLLKRSKAKDSGWIVITLGWGIAVMIAAYTTGYLSGAHLNPALSLALAIKGQLAWSLFFPYVIAQVLGAMLGSTLMFVHYWPHWQGSDDPDAKLAIFCTTPAIRHIPSNLISEIIGTFVLVIGILSLGAQHISDGFAPFIVGMMVVGIGLSLGGTTGYAINPARDLGPRLMHHILPIPGKRDADWSYAFVPVLGPIIGAILAAALSILITSV